MKKSPKRRVAKLMQTRTATICTLKCTTAHFLSTDQLSSVPIIGAERQAPAQRHRSSALSHQIQWPHSLPGRALKAPRGFHPAGVPGQRSNPEQSLRCPTSPLLANLNQAQWVQEKYVGTMNPLKIQRKHPKVSHELHSNMHLRSFE